MRIAAWVMVAVLGTFPALLVGHGPIAYFFAVRHERSWFPANPQTRAELESHLRLYSTREIRPSQSMWGSRAELKPDERMIQYLLLWSAPLDVVYDSDDGIVAIFTSYEQAARPFRSALVAFGGLLQLGVGDLVSSAKRGL